MPTLFDEIKKSVTDFVTTYGDNWYNNLHHDFKWDNEAKPNAVIAAKGFGLNHLGHGTSRVVFRYRRTGFVVKIEKASEFWNQAHDQANTLELLEFNTMGEDKQKFVVQPLDTFEVDDVTMIIYPYIEHDENNETNNELTNKCFNVIDMMFGDQYGGINTFLFRGFWLAVDYAVPNEETCEDDYYNMMRNLVTDTLFEEFVTYMNKFYKRKKKQLAKAV